jgi:small subunit ribosomal protein S1
MINEQDKVKQEPEDQTNPKPEPQQEPESSDAPEKLKTEEEKEEPKDADQQEPKPADDEAEKDDEETKEPVAQEEAPKAETTPEEAPAEEAAPQEEVSPADDEEAPAISIPVAAAEEVKPADQAFITDINAPIKEQKPASQPTPQEDFDWNAVGKQEQAYSEEERQKLEDLYSKTFSTIAEHEVVEGTIAGISDREVVVNINFKSDGVIPRAELRYNPDIKIGDPIEVYVESQEDQTGQLLLSHKKARILKSWERVNLAFENEEIIKGYVKSRTKGGLIVDIFGIEAFLPGSQIDVKPIRDYDIYVDKVMEFKIVKINQEYKNVVVSHKALIELELEQQKAEIIAKLEKGQVLEGTVKNITTYGVFVDLGGVDGLIHITDLSWGRINHPEEVVELDQKIKIVILDFDESKKRIALGLKQLTPHPWDALDENLKVGDKVKGKVVVLADYGAFVEIQPGVEGLLHVSEMSWSQHLRTAQDFLKVGDEVEAVILTLDREERKMSLGMKQLIPDPWENIKERYPVGSKHTASVRNFTNFGIFVELEEGVDGLIHISDLSWSKKIKHPAEFTKVGEQIEVVVLDVDEENRRLSLGHKQLEENPWDVFESVFTVGSIHKGTIANATDKGMIVTLPYGVEGFAPTRHLQKENGSYASTDETLDFKVIEFSKENKKIILSHSRVFQDVQFAEKAKEEKEQQKAQRSAKQAVKKIKDNLEKTTFGDIGGLAELKSEMEQEAREKLEEYAKKQEEKEIKKGKPEAAEETTDEQVAEEKAEVEEKAEDTKKEETPKAEKSAGEGKKEETPKAEEPVEEEKKEEAPEEEKPEEDESASEKDVKSKDA